MGKTWKIHNMLVKLLKTAIFHRGNGDFTKLLIKFMGTVLNNMSPFKCHSITWEDGKIKASHFIGK
jgi:hypothetical protein